MDDRSRPAVNGGRTRQMKCSLTGRGFVLFFTTKQIQLVPLNYWDKYRKPSLHSKTVSRPVTPNPSLKLFQRERQFYPLKKRRKSYTTNPDDVSVMLVLFIQHSCSRSHVYKRFVLLVFLDRVPTVVIQSPNRNLN